MFCVSSWIDCQLKVFIPAQHMESYSLQSPFNFRIVQISGSFKFGRKYRKERMYAR